MSFLSFKKKLQGLQHLQLPSNKDCNIGIKTYIYTYIYTHTYIYLCISLSLYL